jgi:5-formaminoimidazole-4-carboxamide-1-beta-D-ribofuranosyl 5'-monophosphate synthetase
MLVTLAKVHYLSKANEYKLIDKRYEAAMQGLTKVALGHQKMRENLHNLTAPEVRTALTVYGRELVALRDSLSDLP